VCVRESNDCNNFNKNKKHAPNSKALHSELFAELSGRFPSRNEYFRISELRIVRHFSEVFGKFGKKQLPKPRKNIGNFREKRTTFF